jgi:hypothetical protein
MRHLRTLLPLALAAMLVLSLPTASAAVSWDHTLTDPGDDVISVLDPKTQLSDRGEVDILSASVKEQGDDVNVTLELAASMNNEATYQVMLTCDDDDGKTYTFSHLPFTGFIIDGPGLTENDPETYVSADGKLMSWVLPKSKVSATQKVEVTHVESSHLTGMTNYVDTAPDEGGNGGNGGNGGGTSDPINVHHRIEMVELQNVRYTIEITLEGQDAKDVRAEFDMDVDGTVTKAEYDQHIGFHYLEKGSWNSTKLKLDGDSYKTKAMTFEIQGLIGSASSTAPVVQVAVIDVRFDEPEEDATHTYADFISTSEKAGDMWDVTADSQFTLEAPDGWRFKDSELPAGAKTYLTSKGTVITLSGLQMQTDWNASVGAMTSFVIAEKADGSDEEESPGFGAVISVAAVLAASSMAAIAGRRRRR